MKKKVSEPNSYSNVIIGPTKESIAETTHSILAILSLPHVDNSTKVEALHALSSVCSVDGTSLNNCNFTVSSKE